MISKRFRRGLAISIDGVPGADTVVSPPVKHVTLYGADYRGVHANLSVAEGERVSVGTTLFSDRSCPEIKVASPVAGRISEIVIGARRRLASMTIEVEAAVPIGFETERLNTKELLCESGLWAGMVARPFGSVPDPSRRPTALFVSAIDTAPGAPDPGRLIHESDENFARGIEALTNLTDGPVFVCVDQNTPNIPENRRVHTVAISGLHPAGTFGTLIDLVHPLHSGGEIWQIHAQDVIAFGHLLTTGYVSGERIVGQCGPGLKVPQLVQVPMGAHLVDMLADNVADGRWKAMSGPPVGGFESAALRRNHFQVSVLPRPEPTAVRPRRWLPGNTKPPNPDALIPNRAVDLALGPDVPVVPLLRALSVGDVETADRLGARSLLEEDMALVTYAAGGQQDFGMLLRRVLDQIEEAA